MALRYNALGWYNPYAPAFISLGGVAGECPAAGGQQPLRGLIVPMVPGPPANVEPGITEGFVEVRKDAKVMANPPVAAATVTTTTTTTNGSAGGSSGTTAAVDKKLTSAEKSSLRQLAVALCIASCFTLGTAVSFVVVKTIIPCGSANTTLSLQSPNSDLVDWGIRAIDFPFPLFTFIIGVLCFVIRERGGGQAKAIIGFSIFSLIFPLPMLLLSGIVGIYLAVLGGCATASINVIQLVLPAILLFMAMMITPILIYLYIFFRKVMKVKATPPPKTEPQSTTTTATVSTAQPVQPAQPTQPAEPTQPTQVATAATAFPTPTQPVDSVQTQPLPPIPFQPPLSQPYQPYGMQAPAFQSPYQRPPYFPINPNGPPRYPPGMPIFGAAPYGRPPYGGSPNGYNPYRPSMPYRPNPYRF